MDHWQYLFLLLGCLVVTLPLETLFGGRVWRRPRRLLRALWLPVLIFTIWDAAAVAAHHWSFNRAYTTGLELTKGLPVEELVFFVAVPVCAILTLEAVRNILEGRVQIGPWRRRAR